VRHAHVTGAWAQHSNAIRSARVPATKVLELKLVLPLRDKEALDAFIQELADPSSPNYRKFLTPEEFKARFAASDEDVQKVVAFAKSNGMEVTEVTPNHMWVGAKASIAVIEKTFHVQMGYYQHWMESRTFYAPDRAVSIDGLDVDLEGIENLDNAKVIRPANLKTMAKNQVVSWATGSGPSGLFIGNDFRAAYAPGVSLTGTGQVVGLFEFGGYHRSNLAAYAQTAGISLPNIVDVSIDGVNPAAASGADTGEQDLDGEMALSMAPGASIYYYCGNNADNIMNRMATDNIAKQMSCSFGWMPAGSAQSQILAQYAAQGQTFFCASGDSGAFDSANPCWAPGDDPGLTCVGGTSLTTNGRSGPWQSETAWVGSSGGISTNFAIPSYQQGLNMGSNHGSSSMRNMPDVSAQADTDIYFVFNNGQTGGVGGTSAASPLWAGFCALINQQAVANGHATIGNFNQAIYALGKGASYTSCLHDITTGNNFNGSSPNNFSAVGGYDLVTGWGSPNGQATIDALAGANKTGPAGYTWCASENGSFTLPGTCDLAYGANGSFNYLSAKTGTITFNNATFGDPIPGVVKSGYYKTSASVGPAGYTWCASENGSYTLNGTCDVAYGANGQFNYLSNQTGSITFNNSTFGDPIPGVVKAGYYKQVASPATTLVSGAIYEFVAVCSGKALDLTGWSTDDGAKIEQWTRHGGACQQWRVLDMGNGLKFQSVSSGKVLDIPGSNAFAGQVVQQWTDNDTNAQRFGAAYMGSGMWKFWPVLNGGLCLDVSGASTADGAQVQVWTDNGNNAQRWMLYQR